MVRPVTRPTGPGASSGRKPARPALQPLSFVRCCAGRSVVVGHLSPLSVHPVSFSVRPVSFPFARSPFPARSGLFVLSLWNGQSGRGVFAPLPLPLFWSALHECAPYGGAAFDGAPSPIARVRHGPVTSCHNASQPRHALVTPIDTFSTVPEH